MKYKVEHVEVREERDGREVFRQCYCIYRKALIGWKYLEYKPSFSLAKRFLRVLGVQEFVYRDLV